MAVPARKIDVATTEQETKKGAKGLEVRE